MIDTSVRESEELTWIRERFELSTERISTICSELKTENTLSPVNEWIFQMADRLQMAARIIAEVSQKQYFQKDISQIQKDNEVFYDPYSEAGFACSFADPQYARSVLPQAYAEELSFLFREYACCFRDAVLMRFEHLTRYLEWFLEIYSILADESSDLTKGNEIQNTIESFLRDYAIDETLDRLHDWGTDLEPALFEHMLSQDEKVYTEETFFYRMGVPVSEDQRKHILSLLEEKDAKDRYAEVLQMIEADASVNWFGVRGPWYKLPFFIRSLKENKTRKRFCLLPAAATLLETQVDDLGVYGPMAENFLKQLRADRKKYIDSRVKSRLSKAIDVWEEETGMSATEGFAVIKL